MSDDEILTGSIAEDACFTVEQFCAVCALDREWLIIRVQDGLIPVTSAATSSAATEWRFTTATLSRARRMRELERTFDAAPELAALVADMIEEMDALRTRLRRAGLG
ncbi:MAG: chaperone modulator CbpM [Pseudomonadota bacterium]